MWGVVSLMLFLAATGYGHQFVEPLYVGNLTPVTDPYGRALRGSPNPGAEADRCRVEIRIAPYGGVRYPPNPDGTPSPINPLATPDSTGGMGMNAALPDSGIFAKAYPQRLPAGTLIFARAFNAPTAAEATFYSDSKVVTVPEKGSSLTLEFEPARPLDDGDDDGDGLANSWERFLGIDDHLAADYDGDGMLDLHEMLAGTAADDPDSNLSFRSIEREEGLVPAGAGGADPVTPVLVKWQTVPGKTYQLQYVPDLTGEQVFIDVGGEVVAGAGEYEIEMLVDVPADAVSGAFRVQLVLE